MPKRTIIVAFLLIMAGMIAGFKLINDPMIIYFSDPANPRPESWAALLFGAVALLKFLKYKTYQDTFIVIRRFAFWGMIGGGLGFGLGGLWMVMGSHMPDVIFKSWWKAMEFTFGLLFGASLGFAGWLCRKELLVVAKENNTLDETSVLPVWKELAIILVVGLVTYWLIPKSLEPFVDTSKNSESFFISVLYELGRIAVNYIFYGFLFVLVIIRYPQMAWQIGITLTFCHAAIDLFRDFYPETNTFSPFTMYFLFVFLITAVVALLVAYFSRKENSIRNLFLLLIWSCIVVSFSRIAINPESLSTEGLSLCEIVCGRFIVDIFFAVSAMVVSSIIVRKFQSIQ